VGENKWVRHTRVIQKITLRKSVKAIRIVASIVKIRSGEIPDEAI
jgi:hypothetical protein